MDASQINEILFHLRVIELFLACIAGVLLAFFCMVAVKYKGLF